MNPTVESARKMIKSIAPNAEEIPYHMKQPGHASRMMWKLYRYAVAGENVVGIGTFRDHSSLYFFHGRELDDGSGLLEGGGKEMRFITLRSPADSARKEVKQMVRRAFRLKVR